MTFNKSKIYKCIVYAIAAGQVFTPLAHSGDSIPSLNNNSVDISDKDSSEWIANESATLGQELQNSQSMTNYAKSKISQLPESVANDTIKKGFEHVFPDAKFRGGVKLEDGKSFRSAEADVLFPLHETTSSIMFGQLGLRVHDKNSFDGRTFVNTGVGYRADYGDWMLGVNTFIDADVKYDNLRGSIGIEAFKDNLAFSGNYYFPLTGWKESKALDLHEERPAYGWDLRAKGYLPNYPHLGAELAYEQYYGEKVDILGNGNLTSDPYSTSASLVYKPVPLIELKAGYKDAHDAGSETNVNLNFKYSFGTPLSEQLDPSKVTGQTNKQNRTEFVDRNYNIVMEYREQKSRIKIQMAPVKGFSGETVFLTPSVDSRYPVTKYEWVGDPEVISGLANINDPYSTLSLPVLSLDSIAPKEYTLYLKVTDSRGTTVTSERIPVLVELNKDAFESHINLLNEDATFEGDTYILPSLNADNPDGMIVNWRFVRVDKADGERWKVVKPKDVKYLVHSNNVSVESLGGDLVKDEWVEKFRIVYKDKTKAVSLEDINLSIQATGPSGIHTRKAKVKVTPVKDGVNRVTDLKINFPAGTLEENGATDAPVVGTTLTARAFCENNIECTSDFIYKWEVSEDGKSWHTIPGETKSTWQLPHEIGGVSMQSKRIRVSVVGS
ncbi:TPA: inverse autotransporter beta domain-containing protein [Escherichia coli]|uniref:inverse autotransporter beta domain-containing protein n=1 Tax=Escherichia coli TaxID=562 RepID=UPI000BE5B837|nr:inverse autotransporter beta domain-containing protein [Escherichia coli]EFH8318815.1 invasin [Escherichia coli]EFJ1891626.1 invasin [Escherichia coli]EFN2533239.1 invasin [Escherichia coli]EHT2943724.1 inverse autotransporter beta domain-containing protein [Escherichia coli]EJD5586732.1 inverse autotransporter beta domain-containing protein [Escherichia coli]